MNDSNLRLWALVAKIDGQEVIQFPVLGTREAAEQEMRLYGPEYRDAIRIVSLVPEQPLPSDLAPAAWLVTGGRLFRDKAFIGEDAARQSVTERNDGARVVPLGPLASLVAHYADVREAAKAYRRGADVASVESGFIAGAEWQRSREQGGEPVAWASSTNPRYQPIPAVAEDGERFNGNQIYDIPLYAAPPAHPAAALVEALKDLLPELDDALEDLELFGLHSDEGYRKLKDWYRKMLRATRAIDAALKQQSEDAV